MLILLSFLNQYIVNIRSRLLLRVPLKWHWRLKLRSLSFLVPKLDAGTRFGRNPSPSLNTLLNASLAPGSRCRKSSGVSKYAFGQQSVISQSGGWNGIGVSSFVFYYGPHFQLRHCTFCPWYVCSLIFTLPFQLIFRFPPPLNPAFPHVPQDEGKTEYYILSHYRAIVGVSGGGQSGAGQTSSS